LYSSSITDITLVTEWARPHIEGGPLTTLNTLSYSHDIYIQIHTGAIKQASTSGTIYNLGFVY
jgi:hypothetical protein